MPRKTTTENEHNTMYNFYINKVEHLNFVKKVTESGYLRAQSAMLRALMYLYIIDDTVRAKANSIVKDFIIYKKNGDISIK